MYLPASETTGLTSTGNCLIGVELGAKIGVSIEFCNPIELGAGTPEIIYAKNKTELMSSLI